MAPPQLYENALSENQKLKTKLQEAQLELAEVKAKLEKTAQVRGHRGDRGPAGRGVPQGRGLCLPDAGGLRVPPASD